MRGDSHDGKAVVTFSARVIGGKNSAGVETDTQGGVVVLQTIKLNSARLVVEDATHSGQQ